MRQPVARVLVPMALLGLGSIAVISTAGPAGAVSCQRADGESTASDYAWTSDANGYCGILGVGHYFQPSGSSSQYFTGWTYGANSGVNYVSTARVPELVSSVHSGA